MKSKKHEFFVVFLLSALLTGVFLFPLFPHFFEGIPYTHSPEKGFEVVKNFQGDHYQFLYHLALLKKVFEGEISFLTEGYQFSTPYKSSYMTPYFPPLGPLFLLLSFLGYAGAYNALIVLSFLVAMLSSYFYLRHLRVPLPGALLGAVIFSFFPYRVASLYGGHPAGMMIAFIPLFLLLFDTSFSFKSTVLSLAAGLLLIFFAFSEPHYLYFLFLLIPVYFFYIFIRETSFFPVDIKGFWGLFSSLVRFQGRTRFFLWSGFLACEAFVVFYALRRGGRSLTLVLLSFALGFFLFLSWISLGYFLSWLFLQKRFDSRAKESLLAKTVVFNGFYLYFFALVMDIKNLSLFVFLGVFLVYFGAVILPAGPAGWKRGTSDISGYLKKIFSYSIQALSFSWPLLLCMLFCAGYMFHFKESSLDASAIEGGRKLFEVRLFSPKIGDVFKPFNTESSKYVYPGLAAALSCVAGFVLWLIRFRKRKAIEAKDVNFTFFLVLACSTYILSFGPNISMPPLFELSRRFVPFFSFIRSPIKIIVFSALSMSFLSGMIFSEVKKGKMIPAVLIIGVFGEFFYLQDMGISRIDSRNAVLSELKGSDQPGRVLFLPIWPGDSSWSSLYQLYSLQTDRFMINGYQPVVSSDYIEKVANPLYPLNFGRISNKEWIIIQELNVTDIVFQKEAFPRKVSPFPQRFTFLNLKNSPYLEYIIYDDPLYLFKVKNLSKEASEDLKNVPPVCFPFGFTEEGERFRPVTGSVERKAVKDASGGSVLEFPHEEEAAAYLDKYFPDGEYEGFVSCRLLHKEDAFEVAWKIIGPDGAAVPGGEVLFETSTLTEDEKDCYRLPFSFSFPEPGLYRFVLAKKGRGQIQFDYFYLKCKGQTDPYENISACDGIFTGEVVEDAPYSSAVFVDSFEYPPGPAVFAPNRFYKKGSYLAEFYLKKEFSGRSEDILARLQVTDAYGQEIFSEKSVKDRDFKGDSWNIFPLSFELERGRICNFYVHFEGKGKLWVREIRVRGTKGEPSSGKD
ncbi:MAG: hypothetical protein JW928_05640 [Candidatus Aureabacteria bacterium]|nr:hypothetical protein [Candidatus Auribacterota bacterium]